MALPMNKRSLPGPIAALGLILLVLVPLWLRAPVQDVARFDQPFYLGIAHDIRAEGRFTNGYFFDPDPDGARPSGMRFSPLYPALLAAIARIDPGLRAGMDCLAPSHGRALGCPRAAPVMRGLQFAELAAIFLLIWAIGARLGGRTIAWLALAAALFTAPLLLRSVNYLMTEMTTLLFTTAATVCAVLAATARRRIAWSAAAGLCLALAALTRPAFLYLIPAAAIGVALTAPRARDLARALATYLATATLTLAPWFLRNRITLGHTALTYGYDSHTLVQRIAFDTMTWREYAESYLCWLPDGTSLGRRFIGPDGCGRFGWDEHPNSFYVLGLRHMLPETLAAAGGYPHHLAYLLRTYILPAPFWHLAVSVPLALRGAYVSHWWGFGLFWLTLAFALRAWRRRQPYALVAVPALFMLAFNAMVAVNQVRYNLMLVPAYALAAAFLLQAAWQAWRARRHIGFG